MKQLSGFKDTRILGLFGNWSFLYSLNILKSYRPQKKEGQATFIAPLQPHTFATFPSWRIQRELVVKDLPRTNVGRFS
jgi:hypothetical protein